VWVKPSRSFTARSNLRILNPDRLAQFLIDEFGDEEGRGFPRLRSVPDTSARFYVHHYQLLSLSERTVLRRSSVKRALEYFSPLSPPGPALTPDETAALDHWLNASATRKMAGPDGWKYMPLKLVKMGVGWQKRFPPKPGEWAFPDEVVREIDKIETAKAADLRRLIKHEFQQRFGLKARRMGGGDWTYESLGETGSIRVNIDYGHTHGTQIDYEVDVKDNASGIRLRRGSLERLVHFGSGRWDWITSGEAEKSVKLLADIVGYLTKLPARVASAAAETTSESQAR
jgi:hypothetical protein